MDSAYQELVSEVQRAILKHGTHTPANKSMDRRDKLAILAEELGEVARCCNYDQQSDGIRHELIHVAAMAIMWASSE